MGEMAALQRASVFGQVYSVQKPEYSIEVTEASKKAYVLVLLTSSTGLNVESRLMIDIWRQLAREFGEIKFCQMQADLCIEGYPDRNTPTILIYKDGDVVRQIVTLRELQGVKTTSAGNGTANWTALLSTNRRHFQILRNYLSVSERSTSTIADYAMLDLTARASHQCQAHQSRQTRMTMTAIGTEVRCSGTGTTSRH